MVFIKDLVFKIIIKYFYSIILNFQQSIYQKLFKIQNLEHYLLNRLLYFTIVYSMIRIFKFSICITTSIFISNHELF